MSDGTGPKLPSSEKPLAEQEEATLHALAEAIQQLTPEQRRRLMRRLRTSGLLEMDEPLTDRDRMQVAPALGIQARRKLRRMAQKGRPAGPVLVPANPPREEQSDEASSEP